MISAFLVLFFVCLFEGFFVWVLVGLYSQHYSYLLICTVVPGCSASGAALGERLSISVPIVGCCSLAPEPGGQSCTRFMTVLTVRPESDPGSVQGPDGSSRRWGWSWTLLHNVSKEKRSKTTLEAICPQWGYEAGQCWMGCPKMSWARAPRPRRGWLWSSAMLSRSTMT